MESTDDQGDNDYVVTAEMLIHQDIDDERTLEEDEAEDEGEYEEELQELQKEQDMPLEELLSTYYGANVESTLASSSESGDDSAGEDAVPIRVANSTKESIPPSVTEKTPPTVGKEPRPSPVHVPPDLLLPPGLMEDPQPKSSDQNKPPEPVATGSRKRGHHYLHRSGANPEALARLRPVPERLSLKHYGEDNVDSTFNHWLKHTDSDNSSSDEDYIDDWKKEIKVGRDHQACVPSLIANRPYTNENPKGDVLVWSPRRLVDSDIKSYLIRINCILQDQEGLPCGSWDRDNEHALLTLQSCDYDVNRAETIFCQDMSNGHGRPPWTEDECRKFETGLRTIGKDFHLIQKQIPSRSVKELIEFYYLWKKTERYDMFVQYGKMGKKKFNIPPGYLNDFMEDYLEPTRTDFPDLHYGTTTLSAEVKKEKYSSFGVDERLRSIHYTSQKGIATKSS